MTLEVDLNNELARDFPEVQNLKHRQINTAEPVARVAPARSLSSVQQLARPLVRLADALDRIDQLAAAIEKAEAEAAKLLSVVKGKL